MDSLKIYAYKNCDSCRKAVKWLQSNAIAFEEIPIRENPPTIKELNFALKSGYSLVELFNRSGKDYRELNMKETLKTISEKEALELLHKNGNLVKRPFAISGHGVLIGFNEARWAKELS